MAADLERPSSTVRSKISSEIERAIDEAEGKFMLWGEDDCALWCASILQRATGNDPMEHVRGRYHDEHTGRLLIGDRGAGIRGP